MKIWKPWPSNIFSKDLGESEDKFGWTMKSSSFPLCYLFACLNVFDSRELLPHCVSAGADRTFVDLKYRKEVTPWRCSATWHQALPCVLIEVHKSQLIDVKVVRLHFWTFIKYCRVLPGEIAFKKTQFCIERSWQLSAQIVHYKYKENKVHMSGFKGQKTLAVTTKSATYSFNSIVAHPLTVGFFLVFLFLALSYKSFKLKIFSPNDFMHVTLELRVWMDSTPQKSVLEITETSVSVIYTPWSLNSLVIKISCIFP